MRNRHRERTAACIAALAAATWIGCASPEPPLVYLATDEAAAEETAPLGGDALAERKHSMQRAYRDLIHFHTTQESLRHRRDRNGSILFDQFLNTYMGTHLDPLLQHAWQSRHPELMALDAGLRLVQAEVLVRMRDTRRVQHIIEEIQERYAGRENMIVAYPIGGQGSIAQGLETLRNRKWRG
jgi:hypothetical protein